jgi:Flp pilus assembly protein TadD
MGRFLLCSSAIALCMGIAMPSAHADDAKPSAAAANSYPATLAAEIARAKDLRQKGQYADAAKALRQLMLVASNDPRVSGEYGKVLAQQGYAKDAVNLLAKAVQTSSNDWTLYSALGVAYDQLDKHSDARQAYARALAIRPGEPSVTNNYAISRMLTGDYEGAIQMLSGLHTTDPKILANLAKAEDLKSTHAPATPDTETKTASTAATAGVKSPKTSSSDVIMQKVPEDPQAGPVRTAGGAPRALDRKPSRPALAAEAKKLNVKPGSIMMQKVPVDPHAGPVKTATATQVIAEHPAKLVKSAPKPPPPPALRTAAD